MDVELVFENNLDSKIFVMIDSYKISQVIRNLVSNALKFCPPASKIIISLEIVDVPTNRQTSSFSSSRAVAGGSPRRASQQQQLSAILSAVRSQSHLLFYF